MHLLITFETTYEVLMFEKYAKKEKIEGKIIPVPRKFSANCGLSWISDISLKNKILKTIDRFDISYDNFHEIESYNLG